MYTLSKSLRKVIISFADMPGSTNTVISFYNLLVKLLILKWR